MMMWVLAQERERGGEGRARLVVDLHLVDTASLYSTGSSTVMMLMSGLLMRVSAEYSVVVLPDPVGPVTSTMP